MLSLLLLASCAWAEPRVQVVSRGAPAPGEALMIVAEEQPKAPTGRLGGVALQFVKGRNGYVALAGFDVDAATGPVRLELELSDGGSPHLWSSQVFVSTKAFPTEELAVDDKFVRLSPADEARSEAEAAQLKKLYAVEEPRAFFSGGFVSPIPGALSARFGERRVFNGVPKSPHSGADLRAKSGTPVASPADGRVVLTKDLFYSGNTVIVDHGLGLYSIYAHLSRVDVKVGQKVKKGKTLGLVGATGRVTGPHLHWGVKFRGARVDPYSIVELPLERYL